MEVHNVNLINSTTIELYIPLFLVFLLILKLIHFFYYLFSKKYIDLHFHLDGSITLDIAKKLIVLQNMEMKSDEELDKLLSVPENCIDLNQFLNCFKYPVSLLQTKKGLSEAVKLVSDNIQSQGVIYAEIRFAPQLHTEKSMTQEDAIKAVLEGAKRTSLKVNFILCFLRGSKTDEKLKKNNYETLRLAKKYLRKDGGVVAVDLAGAEALYPTSDYKELFDEVKKNGIPFTIHAGEADGAESVKEAIKFGTKRIGHGVRAYEDPEVVKLIKEKGIYLEMCPTSNIQTCAISNMKKYPFMDFLNDGINVTLNTDDMGIERTTLPKEFEYIKNSFGLTDEQETKILLNSIDAAFTTEEVKNDLRRKIKYRFI